MHRSMLFSLAALLFVGACLSNASIVRADNAAAKSRDEKKEEKKKDEPKQGVAPPDYRLGPDDQIDISVDNHADMNRSVTVLPDGTISFPPIGTIVVKDSTPKELAARIQTVLEETLNNCTVLVGVKEMHARKVKIRGIVRSAGSYDLRPGWRLLDLIASAGDMILKPAAVNGRIFRGDTTISINVEQAIAHPEGDANVTLLPDDMVLLDERVYGQIYVMGQVNKPGVYDFDPNMTLLSLLSLSGNQTDKAALSRAYILRNGEKIPINLRLLLVEGKDDDKLMKVVLKPGDVLFLPEIEARYAVMGAVSHSGYYPFPEKGEMTAIQALNEAGGQTSEGDLARAAVVRNLNGKPHVYPVNISKLLKNGDMKGNLTLQPGDIVYVPARHAPFEWNNVLAPLYALGIFGIRLH